MILQALMEYYENLAEQGKLPRQGWCQAKVSYGINLSKSGDIKDIVWLKREEQMGKKAELDSTAYDSPRNGNTFFRSFI